MNADTLRLASRPPVEDEIENWDDDDFLIEGDDITFQSQTNSTVNVASSRRDSQSSFRSDFESIHGEEEKQVHLPGDDEKSTLDAIAAAAKAGIPIPKNVPPSALMGGTIKRLGGRKIKKIIQEDWVDDLEFPDSGHALQIKPRDSSQFPDALRQVSNPTQRKPPRESLTSVQEEQRETISPSISNSYIDLDRFRDNDENDDDFFGDGAGTIKVSKKRQPPRPISLITPPTPKPADTDDDFEKDFELPTDGKLRLSARKDVPKTPTFNTMLDDLDWAEGSLGTRFGGTRRDVHSTRSSSVCAMSPSIASSMTFESEDETFDGLIIPNGPLDFGERLMRRRQSRSPIRVVHEPIKEEREEEKEDFIAGLEIGDGEVFDSRKLTLHRNIQVKETRTSSPSRPKASVALKFTSKPVPAPSRLPRPMGPAANSERSHMQSSLEPVSETGGPISQSSQPRRPLSRLGHSAQSSVNSVNSLGSMGSINSIASPPTPSSTHTVTPSTPSRRRELNQKTSAAVLRPEPTTTSAQLLRLKRSLPAMRATQSPARPVASVRAYDRPPSRTDYSARPQPSTKRPKTPVERMRTSESSAAGSRKGPVPFLPAGASASQSHNINARTLRTFRRHDSETSIEFRPSSRAVSRSTIRSPSPRRHRPTEKATPEGAWGRLSMPRRVKNFGDGHELDGFDDLPTSSQAEAQFLKQPVTNGKASFRGSRNYQTILPDRTANTPSPSITPYSPRVNHSRNDSVPSFARDTTASRIARETSIAQRAPSGPLAPLTTQRVAQLSARSNLVPQPPSHPTVRAKKLRRAPQSKPHLISNLNPPKDPKMVKGMWYNPDSFRWEGNDNVLNAFDVPASSPSTASVPQYLIRERENATPRPALITNIGATKGVQVVGGMIFDPQAMCWLKAAPPQSGNNDNNNNQENDPLDGFNALDDEDDVFKDIPDLEERTMASSDGGNGRSTDIKDDWLVGEEFDVGPEFVRRQREEEDRWRKKCSSWISNQVDRGGDAWKWAIRDIVNQSLAD
ncbi:putative cytokinesis inhibitor byr4 [Cladorrhinum sp. PSN332]|nr:putative cytokinesis inhibitor byr4 [Cladorrhinum sp. PSN332]